MSVNILFSFDSPGGRFLELLVLLEDGHMKTI